LVVMVIGWSSGLIASPLGPLVVSLPRLCARSSNSTCSLALSSDTAITDIAGRTSKYRLYGYSYLPTAACIALRPVGGAPGWLFPGLRYFAITGYLPRANSRGDKPALCTSQQALVASTPFTNSIVTQSPCYTRGPWFAVHLRGGSAPCAQPANHHLRCCCCCEERPLAAPEEDRLLAASVARASRSRWRWSASRFSRTSGRPW
jgi:hypothetical protein